MTWSDERRAAQSARAKAWHAARDPERAKAREAAEREAREIAKARAFGNQKPPLEKPLWRKLVTLIIARTKSGESVTQMSLAHALGVSRTAVLNACLALIKRGYLATNKERFNDMGQLTAMADADGNPWQRDGDLIRVERRGDETVKVCPPRHAAGALIWPQKPARRARA